MLRHGNDLLISHNQSDSSSFLNFNIQLIIVICIADSGRKAQTTVRLLAKLWSRSTKLANIPRNHGEICIALPRVQNVCAVARQQWHHFATISVSLEVLRSCNQRRSAKSFHVGCLMLAFWMHLRAADPKTPGEDANSTKETELRLLCIDLYGVFNLLFSVIVSLSLSYC
jgi:hypothetical protein